MCFTRGWLDWLIHLGTILGPLFTLLGILVGLLACRDRIHDRFLRGRFTHLEVVEVQVGQHARIDPAYHKGPPLRPGLAGQPIPAKDILRVTGHRADECWRPVRDDNMDTRFPSHSCGDPRPSGLGPLAWAWHPQGAACVPVH